ncbi:PTS sugar transporter subunit IIA [Mycoplasmopsis agassizii]|uniref:Mannitol-specific phosphotransferase enzyme IIA component n=1 Tax=Mycoplasmopsis agassizii TaxID=33922 RepID=A0ABX4H4A2_9BACT|nr:PTS sugar transporter subunit IIA [Mycoplasmopsis agassizii]PAF54715.1 hypothetical protein CJF60_03170 [Mycoplasmopsis agassizii]SMC15952.1 PTS system, mannitol-specific IIA component [Mycoplasmopsis agassizii]
MIKLENIKINQNFKDKYEIFKIAEEDLVKLNSVKRGYQQAMINRDKSASVALGNYLFLPHGEDGSQDLILKNEVLVYHLKDVINIDENEIKVVVVLALKASNQMEYIEKIGIAFSDIDDVEKVMFDEQVTAQKIHDFLTQE